MLGAESIAIASIYSRTQARILFVLFNSGIAWDRDHEFLLCGNAAKAGGTYYMVSHSIELPHFSDTDCFLYHSGVNSKTMYSSFFSHDQLKLFQLNFHELIFQPTSNEYTAVIDLVKVKKNNKKDTKLIGSISISSNSRISEVAAEKLVPYTPIFALCIDVITSIKENASLIVFFASITEKNSFRVKLSSFLQSVNKPAEVGINDSIEVTIPSNRDDDASLEIECTGNGYVEDSILDDGMSESITTMSLPHSVDSNDDNIVAPSRVALTSSFNTTSLECINEPVRKISTLNPPVGATSSLLPTIPDFSHVSTNPFSPNPFVETTTKINGASPNPFSGFTPVNTNGVIGGHIPTSSHNKFNVISASPITKINNDLVDDSKVSVGPPSLARRQIYNALSTYDTIGLPPAPATNHFITASPVSIASTRISTSENMNSVTSRKVLEELDNVKKLNEELNEMLERQELLRTSETGALMEQVLALNEEREELMTEIMSLKEALDSTSDALTEMAFVGDDHADRAKNAEEELDLLRHRIRTLTAANSAKHISPTVKSAPATSFQWNDFDDQEDPVPPSPPVATNNLRLNHAILQRKELENTITHLNNQLSIVEEQVTSRIEAEVLKERTRLTKQLAFQETVSAQLQNDIVSVKESALRRNNELEQLLHEQRDLINELSGQLESITDLKRENIQLKGANNSLGTSVSDLKAVQCNLEVELQAVKKELEYSNAELLRIREDSVNNELKASELTRGLRSEIHQLNDKVVTLTACERQLTHNKLNVIALEKELTHTRSKYQEKELAHADELTLLMQQVNELKHNLHEAASNAQTSQHKLSLLLQEQDLMQQELNSEKELRISDQAKSNSDLQELTNRLTASNAAFANKIKLLQEEISGMSMQRAALEEAASNTKMAYDELLVKSSTTEFSLKQSCQQVSVLQDKIKQYDDLITRINLEHEAVRDEKISTIVALEKEVNTQKLSYMNNIQSMESNHCTVKEAYEKLVMASKVDYDIIGKIVTLSGQVRCTIDTKLVADDQVLVSNVETSVFKAPISSTTGKPCKKCIKEKAYCQFHSGSNATASASADNGTKNTTDVLYTLLKDLSLFNVQIGPIRASSDRIANLASDIHSFLVTNDDNGSVSHVPKESLMHTLSGVEQLLHTVFDAIKNEDSTKRFLTNRVDELTSELDTRQHRVMAELTELQQRHDTLKSAKDSLEVRYSHDVNVLQEELNAYMKESDKLQDNYQKDVIQVTKVAEEKYSRLMEEYRAQCDQRLEDKSSRWNQLMELKVNDFAVKEVAMAEEIEKLLKEKKALTEKLALCASSTQEGSRLNEKLSKELSIISTKYSDLKDLYDKVELKLAGETRAKLECERTLRRFGPALTSASLHDTPVNTRSNVSNLDSHRAKMRLSSTVMQNQSYNSVDQLNFSDISLVDVANEDVSLSISPFRAHGIEPISNHSLLSSVSAVNTSSTDKGTVKSSQDWASIRRQKVEKAMQDRGWLKK